MIMRTVTMMKRKKIYKEKITNLLKEYFDVLDKPK